MTTTRSADYIAGQKNACMRILKRLEGGWIDKLTADKITEEVRRIIDGE